MHTAPRACPKSERRSLRPTFVRVLHVAPIIAPQAKDAEESNRPVGLFVYKDIETSMRSSQESVTHHVNEYKF